MELKPCPKCGMNKKRTLPVRCIFETLYKVRCSMCGFETGAFETKEEAREVWNSLIGEAENH